MDKASHLRSIPSRMWRRGLVALLAALLASTSASCVSSGFAAGKLGVVASFYPLAWLAQEVGGDRVSVVDLTPPGIDAHDTILTAAQRADIQEARVVLILGQIGFQPDVEAAAKQTRATVVAMTSVMPAGSMLASSEGGMAFDPHVWLDPVLMMRFVPLIESSFAKADPAGAAAFAAGARAAESRLAALASSFSSGLSACRWRTFVVTHEAFGYLARQYGLTQIGIEGLSPEAEPSAARIQVAIDAIRSGDAAPTVFYENTNEGQRVGTSIAGDAGASAIPLNVLEFQPTGGDYLSAMRFNLAAFERGLRCQG